MRRAVWEAARSSLEDASWQRSFEASSKESAEDESPPNEY
jgi:hypothetical protein